MKTEYEAHMMPLALYDSRTPSSSKPTIAMAVSESGGGQQCIASVLDGVKSDVLQVTATPSASFALPMLEATHAFS